MIDIKSDSKKYGKFNGLDYIVNKNGNDWSIDFIKNESFKTKKLGGSSFYKTITLSNDRDFTKWLLWCDRNGLTPDMLNSIHTNTGNVLEDQIIYYFADKLKRDGWTILKDSDGKEFIKPFDAKDFDFNWFAKESRLAKDDRRLTNFLEWFMGVPDGAILAKRPNGDIEMIILEIKTAKPSKRADFVKKGAPFDYGVQLASYIHFIKELDTSLNITTYNNKPVKITGRIVAMFLDKDGFETTKPNDENVYITDSFCGVDNWNAQMNHLNKVELKSSPVLDAFIVPKLSIAKKWLKDVGNKQSSTVVSINPLDKMYKWRQFNIKWIDAKTPSDKFYAICEELAFNFSNNESFSVNPSFVDNFNFTPNNVIEFIKSRPGKYFDIDYSYNDLINAIIQTCGDTNIWPNIIKPIKKGNNVEKSSFRLKDEDNIKTVKKVENIAKVEDVNVVKNDTYDDLFDNLEF